MEKGRLHLLFTLLQEAGVTCYLVDGILYLGGGLKTPPSGYTIKIQEDTSKTFFVEISEGANDPICLNGIIEIRLTYHHQDKDVPKLLFTSSCNCEMRVSVLVG